MKNPNHLLALLGVVVLAASACTSGSGASTAPSTAASVAPTAAASVAPTTAESGAPSVEPSAAMDPNDLLAKIKAAGVIKVGTDPAYPPQSELKADGTFEGFDIDTANEIGKRLGVKVKFETPDFSVVEAGKWAGRFDISVGSVTVTKARLANLDFTDPYYFTPAQMSATKTSGITTLEGLAGKTICVGEATTYFQWVKGTLELGDGSALAPVPAGLQVTTLKTDQDCALSAKSGRHDFEGWLTSSTTAVAGIAGGAPFVSVGDPVFYEPLAVATDKTGPAHAQLQAALDQIVKDMHADGTLTASSKKWFDGQDLTTKQ
ncbi:MAG: transporter substrate-binding domain-containing protein [Chloroflexota bacterium]